MLQDAMYRRIVLQSQNGQRKPVDINKPWYPKQRVKEEYKDDYKYFYLPPNKMSSLMKKQQMAFPTDQEIRTYIHTHSLKYIVYHGVDPKQFHNKKTSINQMPISPRVQPKQFQIKPQTVHSRTQINRCSPVMRGKKSITVSNKKDNSDLYVQIRRLNNTPHEVIATTTRENTKTHTAEPPIQQPIIRMPDIPNRILPNPARTKQQLRVILLRALKKIKALKVTPSYAVDHKIFSKKPYEKLFSKELLYSTKKNQCREVERLLLLNPYLVFDFDFYNMTALHWACKKGFIEIVEVLLKYNADVDAIDILHRTPLILCIQENHLDIAYLLLQKGAYPWSTALTDLKSAVELNPKAKSLLTQARRLDIVGQFTHKQLLQLI